MSKYLQRNNLIARWLDGRLNKSEKEELDNTGELNALKVVLDDIDTWEVEDFDVEEGLAQLHERKKRSIPVKETKGKYWMRIAAGFVLLMSSCFLWYYLSHQQTIVTTQIAERKTIQLPHGSSVVLDAISSIEYDEKGWEGNRSLHLSGQAFFDVTHGSTFKVTTNTATITVLGTQFNVKTGEGRFLIQCYDGKVLVTYDGKEEIVEKGQSIKIEGGKILRSGHEGVAPDWTQGFSKYSQAPLSQIVADLQKYYKVEINLPEKHASLRFTGTISHNDLEIALSTIFNTMELNYTLREGDKVTVD